MLDNINTDQYESDKLHSFLLEEQICPDCDRFRDECICPDRYGEPDIFDRADSAYERKRDNR